MWNVYASSVPAEPLNPETSSLFAYHKETLVAWGSTHPSPFTASSCPSALLWDCQGGRWAERVGWMGCVCVCLKFSIMPKSIQANPYWSQSTMCVQTIQLNPTRCILRPYLGEAKYTLSYQRQWMSDWHSQFFGKCKHIYYAPPLQAAQIKIRKNKHHTLWLLKKVRKQDFAYQHRSAQRYIKLQLNHHRLTLWW